MNQDETLSLYLWYRYFNEPVLCWPAWKRAAVLSLQERAIGKYCRHYVLNSPACRRCRGLRLSEMAINRRDARLIFSANASLGIAEKMETIVASVTGAISGT